MPSFNLIREPWIPALTLDGASRDFSLLEVIESARGIARISGNPLEAAVLHRLLFAIAHRVRTPKGPRSWLEMWRDRGAFFAEMANYILSQERWFDLYGSERPFLQHPGLVNPSRTPAEIVYERAQGNNPVFLDASLVDAPKPIPSALAARALLVTHAFGGSGTGGLNPLNGNKKDTMYAGPLCARMIALLEGENLSETILFNLTEAKSSGLPSWERPICDVPKQTRTEGLCDLYTRATRNVRLAPGEDGQSCLAVSVVMGEGLLTEEGGHDDPLIPLYFAKTDKKFKPLRVDPAKALWRNSQVLLVHETTEETRPLPSLALIQTLDNDEELEDRQAVRLRTLGVAANAQGPVTEIWRDEALNFGLSLFRSGNGYQRLVGAVTSAEDEADTLRKQLFGFAARYVSDGGGTPDPKDVSRLIEEICPGLNDFWMDIGPEGERLALSPPGEEEWKIRLGRARTRAFNLALDRLVLDARRMRAQFGKPGPAAANPKAKKERQMA